MSTIQIGGNSISFLNPQELDDFITYLILGTNQDYVVHLQKDGIKIDLP